MQHHHSTNVGLAADIETINRRFHGFMRERRYVESTMRRCQRMLKDYAHWLAVRRRRLADLEFEDGPTRRAQADEFFSLGPDSVPAPPDLNPHYRSKVSWPTDEVLADLVQKKPIRHIARELGCSDTLVFRRCRKLKIPMPGRGMWTLKLWNICWPADDQLARLVKEKPVEEIARELRCSAATVYERCKKRGILMPDRRLEKDPTEPGPCSLPAPEGQNPANPGNSDTKPTLSAETLNPQRESNPSDQIRDLNGCRFERLYAAHRPTNQGQPKGIFQNVHSVQICCFRWRLPGLAVQGIFPAQSGRDFEIFSTERRSAVSGGMKLIFFRRFESHY